MKPTSRAAIAALLVAALLASLAPRALGDVDPASDVLLLQEVFFPYEPKVCSELADTLRTELKTTKARGYPLKVAIIVSKADLGGAPQFFGRPQAYAKFLGEELGIYGPDVGRNYQQGLSLLTVMPQGFGFYRSQGAKDVSDVVRKLPPPAGSHTNDLTRATIVAVPKLARAAGTPIPTPTVPTSCSSGGGMPTFVIFAAPVALLVVGAAVVTLINRRRRDEA